MDTNEKEIVNDVKENLEVKEEDEKEEVVIDNAYTQTKPSKDKKKKDLNENEQKTLEISSIKKVKDKTRSDISKSRTKGRDNDRKNKMARNDRGWGEEV